MYERKMFNCGAMGINARSPEKHRLLWSAGLESGALISLLMVNRARKVLYRYGEAAVSGLVLLFKLFYCEIEMNG
jgi:hypothetical protein